MKNAYVDEVVCRGVPGCDIDDSVKEVFQWAYHKKLNRVTMRGVNGYTITIVKTEW